MHARDVNIDNIMLTRLGTSQEHDHMHLGYIGTLGGLDAAYSIKPLGFRIGAVCGVHNDKGQDEED
jgi:hypothetical protein